MELPSLVSQQFSDMNNIWCDVFSYGPPFIGGLPFPHTRGGGRASPIASQAKTSNILRLIHRL
jgi:hypothetical protein